MLSFDSKVIQFRAVVSERLRSRAANLVGFARVSSNLINRVYDFFWSHIFFLFQV
jgi:hypothetical protein